MWYNMTCHTNGYGALFISSADGFNNIVYWVEHPVLVDYRPAVRVTTSAANTGCFVMSANPCKKCGNTERNKWGKCVECKRKNNKLWVENNPEKVKASEIKYRENHRDEVNKRNKKWRDENQQQMSAIRKNWEEKNKDKVREKYRRWKRANKEKGRVYENKRRARKNEGGGSFTVSEWRDVVNRQDGRCLACGKKAKLTIDHVIPVSKGGSSDISNIQGLCGPCNSKKSDREIDYRKHSGRSRWTQKKLFE